MMTWIPRISRLLISVLLIALWLAHPAHAEESGSDNPTETRTQLEPDETHPVYSTSSIWVTSVLVGVAGLFLAALVIGPIVRAEAPDAVPAAISHEEDPAADRH